MDGDFSFSISHQGYRVKNGHVQLHNVEQLRYREDFITSKAVPEEYVSYHRQVQGEAFGEDHQGQREASDVGRGPDQIYFHPEKIAVT